MFLIVSFLKMKRWLVHPSSPTGNNRRIELGGSDVRIASSINNVFVYPHGLNIEQLKDALGRTLSLWPLIAGRCLLIDKEHYFIEMSDNGIPISSIDNTELSKWILDCNVVRSNDDGELKAFLDEVPSEKLIFHYPNEPLLRLKVTHLLQSDEWIMGASWAHVLGDAYVCANFLHALSRFYQQLEPLQPLPIFERRLWRREEADQSLLPHMRHLTESVSNEQWREISTNEQVMYEQLNLHFSGKQLASLRELVSDRTLTIHDIMVAYIILTLNVHCCSNKETLILYISMVINYHGVSDSIAPSNLAANCHLRVWSERFEDPHSLLTIAKSIRKMIIQSRNSKFLERWLPTEDKLLRDMACDDRRINADHFMNGIVVNSNYRYDWANLVSFGHTDKCRFYTDWTKNLLLRIFRLNPTFDGTQWTGRDREGAEVAFRIHKNIARTFFNAWQRDVNENFINVKI